MPWYVNLVLRSIEVELTDPQGIYKNHKHHESPYLMKDGQGGRHAKDKGENTQYYLGHTDNADVYKGIGKQGIVNAF